MNEIGLDIRLRRSQLMGRRMDDERRELSVEERLLDLRRKRMQWSEPVEARSFPVGDFDRFGYPARRDSHGNAID
jgi:hypothetical protein